MKNNAIVSGPTWLPVQKSYDVLIKSRTFMRFVSVPLYKANLHMHRVCAIPIIWFSESTILSQTRDISSFNADFRPRHFFVLDNISVFVSTENRFDAQDISNQSTGSAYTACS